MSKVLPCLWYVIVMLHRIIYHLNQTSLSALNDTNPYNYCSRIHNYITQPIEDGESRPVGRYVEF